MAQVNIVNLKFLNNPAKLTDPFEINITFECFCPLPGIMQWRLIYLAAHQDYVLD